MDDSLREEILSVLKGASDMTIATIRPDGYPQATTVSYVSDGLTIYFGCAAESQKAQNIAYNNKVSLTVTLPYFNWEEIRGLSMGGRATPVTDPNEVNHVSELMLRKFPQILRYALAGKKGLFLVRVTPRSFPFSIIAKGLGTPTSSNSDGALQIASFRDLRVRPARLGAAVVNQRQALSAVDHGSTAAPNKRWRSCSADAKGGCVRPPARRLGKRVRVSGCMT